jgi:hypothetical protein
VATFGDVTPMVDDLREMFGRHDVAGLGDCYNELLRIPQSRSSTSENKPYAKFAEFLFHAL